MYPPPHHQTNDRYKMIEVMRHYPLAMMVSVLKDKPLITHLPLIYNDKTESLTGHIDKYNPQVGCLQNEQVVNLVFRGHDAYISPSIYTTEQLPTWNYIIVHLTGIVKSVIAPEKVKRTIVNMTHFLESPDHQYKLEIDDPNMDRMINYIHAFEIEITQWEGKFKLSQDKCEQDQMNANDQLINTNKRRIDTFMKNVLK